MTDGERSELKSRYASAVASGTRMLTWWLVLLVVLTIVVEQQIRDRRVKTDVLRDDLKAAHVAGRAAREEMGKAYADVDRLVRKMVRCDSMATRSFVRDPDDPGPGHCQATQRSLSAWWAHLHADTALLHGLVAFEPDRLARRYADTTAVTESLEAMAKRLGPSRRSLYPPTFPVSIMTREGEDAGPVTRSEGVPLLAPEPAAVPAGVPQAVTDAPGLPRAVAEDPAATSGAQDPGEEPAAVPGPAEPEAVASADLMPREEAVPELAVSLLEYGAQFNKYARARIGVSSAIADLKKLSAEQQSLPTPFGGFNLEPGLALLGLAAAALLTYLVFLRTAAEARRIALRYRADGGESISTPPGAPSWVYGGDPDLPASVGWSEDRLPGVRRLALVAHAAWIAMATWLVWDVQKLEASKGVRIPLGRFAGDALVAALLLAVVAATLTLWRRPVREPDAPVPPSRPLGRRAFLGAAGAAVLAAVGAAWLVARGRSPRKPPKPALDVHAVAAARPDWWFVNARTGAVHYRPLCKRHLGKLPSLRRGQALPAGRTLHLHEGKEALVLEAVALAAIASGDVPAAVRWLEKAIEFEPFSYRLYDQLVRLFGTTKEHGRVVPLLQGGLARTDSLPDAARTKARAVFEARIERARDREAARAKR